MPNIKSAIKAAKQNIKKRQFNLASIDKIRKATKQMKKLVAAGKVDEAYKALSLTYKALDKAAKKNVIHKNNANRHKSRLSKMIKQQK
jgi:small subunit ribosomal protein S20